MYSWSLAPGGPRASGLSSLWWLSGRRVLVSTTRGIETSSVQWASSGRVAGDRDATSQSSQQSWARPTAVLESSASSSQQQHHEPPVSDGQARA